jgi:hypothetical protein
MSQEKIDGKEAAGGAFVIRKLGLSELDPDLQTPHARPTQYHGIQANKFPVRYLRSHIAYSAYFSRRLRRGR